MRYSDTITPSWTLSDPARPNIRVIPPKSSKLDGYEPPTIEIYAILRKIRKLGALRPENMRFMAYFSTFPAYRTPEALYSGGTAKAINVMFLAKNVMSFFLLGPMNGSHTFGKRTEIYSKFYAGSPAP